VDSTGQTIDFLLTAKRDAAAAKRFFRKTLLDPANPQLRVINVDKNRTYPEAVEELKVEGTLRRRCRLRQCKYLNNVVEQGPSRFEKASMVGKRIPIVSTAWWTLQGIEAVHMIRKGRARWVGKGDALAQEPADSSIPEVFATIPVIPNLDHYARKFLDFMQTFRRTAAAQRA
jgi:transposase-like protein